jgi:hypothetical protein
MSQHLSGWLYLAQTVMQRLALVLVAGLALALGGWSLAAAAGLMPWLGLEVGLGDARVEAGPLIQLATTALLAGLCFFLPTNARVLQLEASHRSFHATMWDVARAYQAAHAADRDGVFTLGREFDSVRERLAHLRRHPDLGKLEPEVLELAAQMSHESRALAETYATERVERARQFLRQRREEADAMIERIEAAKTACHEIRHALEDVEADEVAVGAELERLRDEVAALTAGLVPERHRDVVPMHSFAAE